MLSFILFHSRRVTTISKFWKRKKAHSTCKLCACLHMAMWYMCIGLYRWRTEQFSSSFIHSLKLLDLLKVTQRGHKKYWAGTRKTWVYLNCCHHRNTEKRESLANCIICASNLGTSSKSVVNQQSQLEVSQQATL